jgi:hypothetical protein
MPLYPPQTPHELTCAQTRATTVGSQQQTARAMAWPDRLVWSILWNENWQRKPKYLQEACPSATFPTMNPTCPEIEPGLPVWEAGMTIFTFALWSPWSISFLFQMHVLYVLSFIVERVGYAIRPYSDSLIQYLPLMWEESAEHNMLRCAIVSTLVHLVKVCVLSSCCASFLCVNGELSMMDFIGETCSVIVLDKATVYTLYARILISFLTCYENNIRSGEFHFLG